MKVSARSAWLFPLFAIQYCTCKFFFLWALGAFAETNTAIEELSLLKGELQNLPAE